MYRNLRAYIEELERNKDLIRIRRFVNPVLEMAEIADRMVKSNGKALLYENTGTGFPVLLNMFGSRERMLAALGLNKYSEVEGKINQLFGQVMTPRQTLWDKLKLLPTLAQAAQWMPKVSDKRGACQEVVMAEPDLSKLPILQCWPHDGGRFITLPMVHTRDPRTGIRNVGMYRMQVFSNNTTGMHWHRHKTGARHFREFKEMSSEEKTNSPSSILHSQFPVAIALGGDPVYTFCATAPMPDNMDEYLLAGFLRNKRVDLVRCLTQPLEVPADADFVIEGYVDTQEPPVIEGPFGDHTGFYSLEDVYPTLHVTCITHRKDAVYPATIVGIPPQEDAYIAQATERIFLAPIRLAIAPEVVDMHMPFEGVSHNIVIIKIKKDYPGQAIKVANALWGAGQMMFNKIMVVVDGDVSLTDYHELLQHISKHYNPATDTYFSSGPLDVLDHAASAPACGGKICIDATNKMENEKTYSENNSQFSTLNSAKPIFNSPLFTFTHKGELPQSRIVVQFDNEVNLKDFPTCVWLLGNNIDAVRDCKVENDQLVADATSKPQTIAPRRWPNVVCMDNQTIVTVNNKWASYGFGKFVKSPSLKYRPLVKNEGAALTDFPQRHEEHKDCFAPRNDDTKYIIASDSETISDDTESEIANREVEILTEPETSYWNSPLGWLKIEATGTGIRSVLFHEEQPDEVEITNELVKECIRQLTGYFDGSLRTFDLPLDPLGTDFQQRVWNELCSIPYAETISYTDLARRLGDTKAVRAVAAANGQNKLMIIIPCHRVIGANGKLVGYAGGLPRKEKLLQHELRYAGQGLFRIDN